MPDASREFSPYNRDKWFASEWEEQMDILVADDRAKVRSALRLMLGSGLFAGLSVTGEAVDAKGLLAQAMATRPDLLLLDWELPGLHRNGLLRTLRHVCPNLSVIALSGRPEARQAALSAGVDAFVSKGDPPERLMAAIHRCRDQC
jgi:two-component system response regulator DesR